MSKPVLLISTQTGLIPNICDNSIPNDLILYIDDFVYYDSIYYKKEITLRNLCSIDDDKKIYLAFKTENKKSKKRILVHKRGNIAITKEEYNKFVDVMKSNYYQDFDSGLFEFSFKEIKAVDDLNNLKENVEIISSLFINDLVLKYKMLKIENDKLVVCDLFDCNCCGDLNKGYLEHLKEMKEINCFYYLTKHNINIINSFLKN